MRDYSRHCWNIPGREMYENWSGCSNRPSSTAVQSSWGLCTCPGTSSRQSRQRCEQRYERDHRTARQQTAANLTTEYQITGCQPKNGNPAPRSLPRVIRLILRSWRPAVSLRRKSSSRQCLKRVFTPRAVPDSPTRVESCCTLSGRNTSRCSKKIGMRDGSDRSL